MVFRRMAASLLAILCCTGLAQAAPALWKVSDGDSAVWLFGSVHVLPPDLPWRTPQFDAILASADKVYFETPISAEAQPAILAATLRGGMATDGVLLTDKIPAPLAKRLRKVAGQYDVPMASLLAMRPWFAAATISAAASAGSGFDPQAGVDILLQRELPPEKQGFFETAEEQIAVLGGADDAEGVSMLAATLDEVGTTGATMNALIAAWLDGTPEELGAMFMAEMGGYGGTLMDRLVHRRNRNWAERIDTMLERNEAALIVVGAGHLVDEISVVRLLEARGFTSERVQ